MEKIPFKILHSITIGFLNDDAMSIAKIDELEGVFWFHELDNNVIYIGILKFDLENGTLLENYSIQLSYFPSGSEISNGNQLNIYGYNPEHNEVAFIRVC